MARGKKATIDPIEIISAIDKKYFGHRERVTDWATILDTTPTKARYILTKLVELGVADRDIHETAHDRISYGFNLNVKIAYYVIWSHKIVEYKKKHGYK